MNPSYYRTGRPIECIEMIERLGLGYCLGNTLKYLWRLGRKDDFDLDLQKARWYLDRWIQGYADKSPIHMTVGANLLTMITAIRLQPTVTCADDCIAVFLESHL